MDLNDHSGTTAAGLHMAALDGVWQTMLTGFAGVRVHDGVMHVRPVLPGRWSRMVIAFRASGRCVRLDITPSGTRVRTDGPVALTIADRPTELVFGESCWPTTTEGKP